MCNLGPLKRENMLSNTNIAILNIARLKPGKRMNRSNRDRPQKGIWWMAHCLEHIPLLPEKNLFKGFVINHLWG